MKTSVKELPESKIELSIEAVAADLKPYKQAALQELQPEVSAPGFRKGKAPLNIVEKQVDAKFLESKFVDIALTDLYRQALTENDKQPLSRPEVNIKKIVPYETLEFEVTVTVVPPIKLPDYTKLSKKRTEVKVVKKDIDEVLQNLQTRMAKREEVDRQAKENDELIIDFKGTNDKGKAVAGASGKDYPLRIGSKQFIDGFEENLIGKKAGEKLSFTLTFPKDYGHKPLANKDVTFEVEIKKVQELVEPKLDDAFAAEVGPFKSAAELKEDIEKQLTQQKEQEAESKLRDSIIEDIVAKTDFEVPQVLIEENSETIMNELKQDLLYRGITLPEYLEQSGMKEDEYRKKEVLPKAERRVKTGLVISAIADKEKIAVTPEELEIRLQLLKGQHQQDQNMQQQLETPDARREVASRMITEKTIEKLVGYATK